MAKPLTAEELLERERTKQLRISLRATVRGLQNSHGTLERAFEEAGCTCHTDRGELKALEAELAESYPNDLRALIRRDLEHPDSQLNKGIDTCKLDYPYDPNINLYNVRKRLGEVNSRYARLAELRESIKATDAREHPALNRAAHAARPWLNMWVVDHPELAGRPLKEIAEAYATAWVHEKWRPTAGWPDDKE